MKNFKFSTAVFIICFVLLDAVLSTPQIYKASDGKDYLIETELKYNWYQAWHECARRDYQLIVIDSAAKNNVIIDLLKNVTGKSQNLWLGGNDEYSSSTDYNRPFYWSATGNKFNFSYWSDNNPDNYKSQEHCVHIWDTKPLYEWNDIGCTSVMGFICEVNHYVEKYQKDVASKCNSVRQSSSVISAELNKVQEEQLFEINNKILKIHFLKEVWKTKLYVVQNATQLALIKLFNEQQNTVKTLTEKLIQQFSDLDVKLKQSLTEINTQFSAKLNAEQTGLVEIC